ncbi:DUF748 domain-containing protein [Gallaecimonas sp. GXIMD4217]|uniref:DUF748 domain-containing protein n=1 Tax=Gallaecimonas sp. GXIMD4217 TaxID=3131927 RepID=UPI00311B074B
MKRREKWLLSLAVILLLYVGATAWLLPWFLKNRVPALVAEQLPVRLTLGDVRFRPFAWRLELGPGALTDAKGQPLASWQALVVDANWRSAVHLGPWLDEVQGQGVQLWASRDGDGRLNWLELLPPSDARAQSSEPAKPFYYSLAALNLRHGRIHWLDGDFPQRTLSLAYLDLDNVTNIPERGATALALLAGLADGGIALRGELDLAREKLDLNILVGELAPEAFWHYVKPQLPMDLQGGRLALRGRLSGPFGAPSLSLEQLHLGQGRLDGDGNEASLAWQGLDVADLRLDTAPLSLAVAGITLNGPELIASRNIEGQLDWLALLPPATETDQASAEPVPISLGALRIERGLVAFRDQGLQGDWQLGMELLAREVALPALPAFPVELALTLGEGRVELAGELEAARGASLTTHIRALPLAAADALVRHVSHASLTQGSLDGDFKLDLNWQGEPSGTVLGDTTINNLLLTRAGSDTALLSLPKGEISAIDLQLAPKMLSIGRVHLAGLDTGLTIEKDGGISWASLLKAQPQADGEEKTDDAGKAFDYQVKAILLEDGRLAFADKSLKPAFASQIHGLGGTVKGLASHPEAGMTIDLKGLVESHGRVAVSGGLAPAEPLRKTEVVANFSNLELTTLTPYARRFAGYYIDKGKLDLMLDYKIQEARLKGQNRAVFDQLELGQKDQESDAPSLPLGLALALLKDGNGRIELSLPVEGDVDSPEFSIGGLIGKAFFNAITKVVTAPFSLLASLVDFDPDKLSQVNFAPGEAGLDDEQQQAMHKVAEALHKRPVLALELRGQVTDQDRQQLASLALEQALAAGSSLAALYDSRHGQGSWQQLPEPAREQLARQQLLANWPVGELGLRQLALDRAKAIGELLVADGIAAERIFYLEPAPMGRGTPTLALNLTAK